jgi:hypothetical protein
MKYTRIDVIMTIMTIMIYKKGDKKKVKNNIF